MPAGSISTIERFQRLHKIRELSEDGKTDFEIANAIGMSLSSVKRNKIYLEDLAVADLTAKESGEKRGELYLELVEATEEAKERYMHFKDKKPSIAKSFFTSWLESIELRAKLYGLTNIRMDNVSPSVTNNMLVIESDKIDTSAGKHLADMLKASHERRLKNNA